MVTAQVFTDQYGDQVIARRSFDDMAAAERYAMNVLGFESLHGTITLVRINDSMTGETGEFEY